MRALFLALVLVFVPARGRADGVEDAEAKFQLGRTAYQEGRYGDAAAAFEGAYALQPNPSLLFNLARAHHKHYLVGHDATALRRAVEGYRQYLTDMPSGPNHENAIASLRELTPLLGQIDPQAIGAPPPAPPPPTKLVISSVPTGAEVAIDDELGKPRGVTPQTIEGLTPGSHVLFLRSPGFQSAQRTVALVPGESMQVEIALQRIERRAGTPLYKRWWLWTAVGGAAAALAIGLAVGLTPNNASVPDTPGGHVPVRF